MAGWLAYFSVLGDSHNRINAGFFSWYADYPDPADIYFPLLSCAALSPDNIYKDNAAQFCDPRIDAQAQRALGLERSKPAEARAAWAAVDRSVTDQAPWVPVYTPR